MTKVYAKAVKVNPDASGFTEGGLYEVLSEEGSRLFIAKDNKGVVRTCLWDFCAHGVIWERVERQDKTWGEMSPEEKGALLLAHHEGKIIELTNSYYEGWTGAGEPVWHNSSCYRVKPEPKVETIEVRGKPGDTFWEKAFWNESDNLKITFDLVDGEPDWNTLKGETLDPKD